MKISEFVEQIAIRFDAKLSKLEQFDAFKSDCMIHLKKFEGETLGFAFHEIVYQRKYSTHPKMAEIVKVCNSKLTTDHKAANPISAAQVKHLINKKLAKEFESTDAFEWAARRMIGWDVLLHIEKHGAKPSNLDVDRFLKAHEEFPKTIKACQEREGYGEFIKLGKTLEQRNREYFNKYN